MRGKVKDGRLYSVYAVVDILCWPTLYMCVCVRECVCMCVSVCVRVWSVESWAHNPVDTGSDPRVGGKFLSIKIVPRAVAHQRVPGLVLGSKVHWLCLADR